MEITYENFYTFGRIDEPQWIWFCFTHDLQCVIFLKKTKNKKKDFWCLLITSLQFLNFFQKNISEFKTENNVTRPCQMALQSPQTSVAIAYNCLHLTKTKIMQIWSVKSTRLRSPQQNTYYHKTLEKHGRSVNPKT